VPGGQLGVDTLQEGERLGPVRRVLVDLERRTGVQRRLDQPRGLDIIRAAWRVSTPPELRPREVRARWDGGIEDDVWHPTVGPLRRQEGLELALGALLPMPAQADGDERRVPAPLMGIQARRRHRRAAGPIAIQDLERRLEQLRIMTRGAAIIRGAAHARIDGRLVARSHAPIATSATPSTS
jgi:hypothetical protein